MALSLQLQQAGMTAESIQAKATVSLDKVDGGFGITESHLEVKVHVVGGDPAAMEKATNDAKAGCPVSKVLNAKVTMNATYQS